MYHIYAKAQGQRTFRAMDMQRGIQVNNIIYATMHEEAEAIQFMEGDAKLNPTWEFQLREIKGL